MFICVIVNYNNFFFDAALELARILGVYIYSKGIENANIANKFVYAMAFSTIFVLLTAPFRRLIRIENELERRKQENSKPD